MWQGLGTVPASDFVPLRRLLDVMATPVERGAHRYSRGAVVLSHSTDIFTNLAIEQALLAGARYRPPEAFVKANQLTPKPDIIGGTGPLLFVYRNAPCVVIGSNQIAWREANIPLVGRSVESASNGPPVLARRNSGGGAVYHDDGNLCLSFLTHRQTHHPQSNMQWIARWLCDWTRDNSLQCRSSDRHDLFVNDRKISGSAMKLVRCSAYHHCTMLVETSPSDVGPSLRSVLGHDAFSETPCMSSVRSPVTRIADLAPRTLNAESIRRSAGATEALAARLMEDWSRNVAPDGTLPIVHVAESDARATSYLDVVSRREIPTSIADQIAAAKEWDWRFAQSLKFTADCPTFDIDSINCSVKLSLKTLRGSIAEVRCVVTSPDLVGDQIAAFEAAVVAALSDRKLRPDEMDNGLEAFQRTCCDHGIVDDARAAEIVWREFVASFNDACGWW